MQGETEGAMKISVSRASKRALCLDNIKSKLNLANLHNYFLQCAVLGNHSKRKCVVIFRNWAPVAKTMAVNHSHLSHFLWGCLSPLALCPLPLCALHPESQGAVSWVLEMISGLWVSLSLDYTSGGRMR